MACDAQTLIDDAACSICTFGADGVSINMLCGWANAVAAGGGAPIIGGEGGGVIGGEGGGVIGVE